MRGFVGLLIGLLLGAGAMYLALRPPWAGGGSAPAIDAGVATAAPVDGGKPGHGKRPRGGHGPRVGGPGMPNMPPQPGDDVQPITDNPSDEPDPFAADGRGPSGNGGAPPSAPAVPQVHVAGAEATIEWRGDAVALPPRTVDASSNADSRSLDQGEIESGLSSGAGAIKSCVERAAANTDLRGAITVQMLVDGSGRVTKMRIQAARYLLDHGGYDCARRAATGLRFSAVGGHTIVTLPITIS